MGLELYNLPFYNNSGETIPPFSIMQVDEWTEANDRDYFRVRKPNGSGKQYIFNGPTSIASNGDGMGSRAPGIQAAYNISDTPSNDQEWGASTGSWLISPGSGFHIVGDVGVVGSVNVVRVAIAPGDATPSPVVLFELTQDKAYADTAKLAKPLDASGVIDSGADAFYVLDANGRFYGKAVDGIDPGYKGSAILVTDSHSGPDGTKPGYRIITMEGPAHFLTGILSGSYSGGGTPFTPSTTQIWGRPFRGRRLPPSGDITVMDDDGVASNAKNGDKWLIAWNEAAANYSFVTNLGEQYVTIKGTSPGVTSATATFTLGSPVAVNGPLPAGTITVTNEPKLDSPSGRTIYARFNVTRGTGTLLTAWDTGDAGNFVEMVRGLGNWNTSDNQVIDHDGDADPHWHGTGPCSP